MEMKYKGSKMDFTQERICDLMRAYKDYIASCRYISLRKAYAAIVDTPSKRFWVSATRASHIVSAMKKGMPVLESMGPQRKEMYGEIYRRVIALAEKRPELCMIELCTIVVSQPAPKFYLAPGSAKVMICKAKRKWVEMKLEDLRHSLSQR